MRERNIALDYRASPTAFVWEKFYKFYSFDKQPLRHRVDNSRNVVSAGHIQVTVAA
jgi:hypothetical protein